MSFECLNVSAILNPALTFTYDGYTDCFVDSWARTRGAQLTAGYTVNTYSKPPLCYTLGALAPLRPAVLTHGGRATHGTHTRAWRPSAARGQTRDARQTRLTNQPTNQPANRTAAVLPVPSCKLGTATLVDTVTLLGL